MTLNLSPVKEPPELTPRILVFGVGGAGCNAVNNMLRASLEGVECVVANTDAQALAQSKCPRTIQLGRSITQGLGAGSRPEIGRAAAEEAIGEIIEHLQGSHMVFITAGMGGGTGTGAAPVIARLAREQGVLTVGVVTKPFHFEGSHRMRVAEAGLQELQDVVDTLIVIPNQNLFRIANERTTFADAFAMADEVLHSGVRGITDLMVMPGLINLDFADIRTVMGEMGKAMMGAGEADGDNRAIRAAEAAISNPLLDDVSMAGARGLLINITGGTDLTLYEVDEAANRIRDEVDPQANIIFGSIFDDKLDGRVRVSVFATGIDTAVAQKAKPAAVPTISTTPTRAANAEFSRAAEPAPQVAAAMDQRYETLDTSHLHIEQRQNEMFAGKPAAAAQPERVLRIDSTDIPEMPGAARSAARGTDATRPAKKESALFGLFGRRKTEEPTPMVVQQQPPRPAPRMTQQPSAEQPRTIVQQPVQPAAQPAAQMAPAPQPMQAAEPVAPPMPAAQPAAEAPRQVAMRISRPVFQERTQPRVEARPAPAAPPAPAAASASPAFVKRAPAPQQAAVAQAAAPVAQPAAPQPAPQPALKPVARAPEPVAVKQPTSEDDLLEIPAFLRRQAN